MEIGKKIKQLRQHKGMTQEKLAEYLNVSFQAVSKWENGTASPDIALLPKLSTYFGITIDDLFTMSEDAHLERIENMLESQQFLSEQDELYAKRYLTELLDKKDRAAAGHGLLAELYNHKAKSCHTLAQEHAKKALELEPLKKSNHVALIEASRGVFTDWNYTNHHVLIDYYQSFCAAHPEYRSGYLWLMDQLIADGRLTEAEAVIQRLKTVDGGYIVGVYEGKLAKAAGRHDDAVKLWDNMVEAYPENWLSYACRADEKTLLGQYESALLDYEKAMTIQPQPRYYDGFESQAHIYEILGQPEKAVGKYNEIINLLKEEWQISFGEMVDRQKREIEKLRAK